MILDLCPHILLRTSAGRLYIHSAEVHKSRLSTVYCML